MYIARNTVAIIPLTVPKVTYAPRVAIMHIRCIAYISLNIYRLRASQYTKRDTAVPARQIRIIAKMDISSESFPFSYADIPFCYGNAGTADSFSLNNKIS